MDRVAIDSKGGCRLISLLSDILYYITVISFYFIANKIAKFHMLKLYKIRYLNN